MPGALDEPVGPGRDVLGLHRLGREIRNVGAARERSLEFSGAATDLADALQI